MHPIQQPLPFEIAYCIATVGQHLMYCNCFRLAVQFDDQRRAIRHAKELIGSGKNLRLTPFSIYLYNIRSRMALYEFIQFHSLDTELGLVAAKGIYPIFRELRLAVVLSKHKERGASPIAHRRGYQFTVNQVIDFYLSSNALGIFGQRFKRNDSTPVSNELCCQHREEACIRAYIVEHHAGSQ